MTAITDSWHRARLAIALLALDPAGLGGAVIRMRAGPARTALLTGLDALPLPLRRIHPGIADEQLFGGIDIAATLSSAQVIENKGLLSTPSAIFLTMAERCPAALAGKLALEMDKHHSHCLIALDEGASEDETCPPALADRLAFHISFEDRMPPDEAPVPAGTKAADPADVTVPDDQTEALTALAHQLGIDSLRAPQLALRAARAHAALHVRDTTTQADIEVAAALVLAPRAIHLPLAEEDTSDDAPDTPDSPSEDEQNTDTTVLPDADMLIDAMKAALPADLLAGLVPAGTARSAAGAGAGVKRKSNRRGRPLPSQPGRLDGTNRIDLVATLRAAAPWQPLRTRQQPDKPGLHIRPSDIRVKRYQERSDRLLVFAVDASGSAAVSRLGEAKGAIEILLAQAYATRDHVALIAFRGDAAEVLLPPTKSLVQTKKRLAALPGGGGTPLASGLQQGYLMAAAGRAKGLTPTLIVITDGRANIALDGTANRTRAAADAMTCAGAIRAASVPGLIIDMSNRPQPTLRDLSAALGGAYIALPRADARKLSDAVNASLAEA